MTLTEVFTSIANAINAKGVSGKIKPSEIADKIAQIPAGGGYTADELTKAESVYCLLY